MIAIQLDIPVLLVVVCIDSFLFYKYLVKLGTTKKKRLIINIIAFRQSYERKELAEIRWVTGDYNPANIITKSASNGAFSKLINNN
jgi:hypothetical protein